MATKAQAGRLSTLFIGGPTGATGTETWTKIGEVKSAPISGTSIDLIDVTSFDSNSVMERILGIENPGEIPIEFNRVTSDAGQILLKTAHTSKVAYDFKIQLPMTSTQTTAGDTFTGSAIVTKYDMALSTKDAITNSVTLTRTGTWTETAGS